jgi:preprotein translocase subunit YajC
LYQLLEVIQGVLFGGVAYAAESEGAPQGAQGGLLSMLPMLAIMFFIFYFLILRPQKKKQQQHDQMLSSISRGDTVITAGGFFGRVSEILDDSYVIEIADGVKARILKSSISTRREAGEPRPKNRRLKKRRRDRDGAGNAEKPGTVDVAADEKSVGGKDEQSLLAKNGDRGANGEVSYEENEALMAVSGTDESGGASESAHAEHK